MLHIKRADDFHIDSNLLTFSIENTETGKVIQAHYRTHFTFSFGKPELLDPTVTVYDENNDMVLFLPEPIEGIALAEIHNACYLLIDVLINPDAFENDFDFNVDYLESIKLEPNGIFYVLSEDYED